MYNRIKYTKIFCKGLSQVELIKNLKKVTIIEVYPIFKYSDIFLNYKKINIIGMDDNPINPLKNEYNQTYKIRNQIKNHVIMKNNKSIVECSVLKYTKT